MAPWPSARSCTPSPARPRTTSSPSCAGQGALVYDADGRGVRRRHGQPLVLERRLRPRARSPTPSPPRCARLESPTHCFDPFTNEPADELAEPAGRPGRRVDDARVFLTCDGSEAVDSAIKLARIAQVQAGHPERTLIVSRTLRLPRRHLRRPERRRACRPTRPASVRSCDGFVNLPSNDLEAHGRACSPSRATRSPPSSPSRCRARAACARRSTGYLEGLRRLCDQHGAYLDHGRGDLRLRPPRPLVRQRLLRRPARPDHLRQGRDVGLRARSAACWSARPCARPLEADAAFWLRHGHTYSGHATACAAGAGGDGDHRAARPAWSGSKHVGDRLADGPARPGRRRRARRGAGRRRRVGAWRCPEGQDPVAVRDRMLDARRHHAGRRHRHADVLPAARHHRRPDRPDRRRRRQPASAERCSRASGADDVAAGARPVESASDLAVTPASVDAARRAAADRQRIALRWAALLGDRRAPGSACSRSTADVAAHRRRCSRRPTTRPRRRRAWPRSRSFYVHPGTGASAVEARRRSQHGAGRGRCRRRTTTCALWSRSRPTCGPGGCTPSDSAPDGASASRPAPSASSSAHRHGAPTVARCGAAGRLAPSSWTTCTTTPPWPASIGRSRRRAEPADGAGRARAAGGHDRRRRRAHARACATCSTPPTRVEVEEVDPWLDGGSPTARVRFRWHRHPPRSTVEIHGRRWHRRSRPAMTELGATVEPQRGLLRPRPHADQRLVGVRLRASPPGASDLVHVPPARAGRRRRARLPRSRGQRRQGRQGARAHPGRRGRQSARPTWWPSTRTSSRSSCDKVRPEARSLLEMHRRAGRDTYIVSASPQEIVEPAGRRPRDGRRHRHRVRGRRTASTRASWSARSATARARSRPSREVAEWEGYDLGRCYAYSDSASDLPMLEAVGHPVAVNPDRQLESVAHERGWPIVIFHRKHPQGGQAA